MPNVISKSRRIKRRPFRKHGGNKPVRQRQMRRAIRSVVKRIPRPQLKYLDAFGNTTITSGGNFAELICLAQNNSISSGPQSNIVQGFTQNNLIGYKGKWNSYQYRCSLSRASLTPTDSFVRMISFIWKPSELTGSGAPNDPTIFQILDNGLSATADQFTYLSPYSREWAKQYRIIADKTYTVAQGQTELVLDKFYKKMHIPFTAFAPIETGTTLTSNVPYIFFIWSTGTAATQPVINFWPRLSYTNS